MRKKKVSQELVEQIYEDLKTFHLGKENAISRKEYANWFGLTERDMRRVTHEINDNEAFELLISTNQALYACNTKDECIQATGVTYRQAFNLLRKARKMEQKVRKNGQLKFDNNDFKMLISYFYPRTVEEEENADRL